MRAVGRPFRFAVTARLAATAAEWRDKARRAEALGYDVLLMPDHLGGQFAPVPALMAAADATTRMRIGSFVFANDYRNPVLLAKEAATIDLLSDGRLDFGLGAGWHKRDYERMGVSYDPPATRVDRMVEALRLIKRLFTEDEVDFAGEHYVVRGARLTPRPVQRPRPPIMVGGGGPRLLAIAAREADIVALVPQVGPDGRHKIGQITAGATAAKIARVRAVAGARFDALQFNVIVLDAEVTDAARSVAERIATRLKATVNAVVHSPYFLFGSREAIRADLLEFRGRLGIGYYAIPDGAMEDFAPLVADLSGR